MRRFLTIALIAGLGTTAMAAGDRNDPNAMRCKRIQKTGTRVKEKVCLTNSQWEAARARGSRFTSEIQQRAGRGQLPTE